MSTARFYRTAKRQLGQFFTPRGVARRIVDAIALPPGARVLEPSFGDGAFLEALVDSAAARGAPIDLVGCEIDPALHAQCAADPRLAASATLVATDFFRWMPQGVGVVDFLDRDAYLARNWAHFDLIVGNPPFGGSIDAGLQDRLDAIYGTRHGAKIKKETYSFFVVKCLDLLRPGGQLVFICSDTFLTIHTMRGLRAYLMSVADVDVRRLDNAFDETNHPMVVLHVTKPRDDCRRPHTVTVDSRRLADDAIRRTANLSWRIDDDHARYFSGATIGDVLVATSGMTIGNNELFVREIVDGHIVEPYRFEFFDEPITAARERERARLNYLSDRQLAALREQEAAGATRRNVRAVPLDEPVSIALPDPRYLPYNKASSDIVFAPPRWAVYWADDGDAVRTFKRNGNWYLHGVGGRPFFRRPGFTWALVSPRLHARFLPEGYILDSGAPCAFPRPGVDFDEVYFLLAWTLTDAFNHLLKTVMNHTRNIQGKDVERMPYPVWIDADAKRAIVDYTRRLIDGARAGSTFGHRSPEVRALDAMFALVGEATRLAAPPESAMASLFD